MDLNPFTNKDKDNEEKENLASILENSKKWKKS